jgi:hypothetical protein
MRPVWPSQSDYILALQDPATAFTDPMLRTGIVESDPVLDLPKPRSGQMASVYKIFDGRKTWAIRCFNFPSTVRAGRYSVISDFLAVTPNPYTVNFEYSSHGIIVGGVPYPIVKMEWVEGDLLHTYLERHIGVTSVLDRLAQRWIAMAEHLHALGFAHGDLQHGNVLVTSDGELKLIDYDGMFVPGFAGAPSTEDGHPNYQHPCRRSHDFGPQLDNFSAWTVFLSIVAFAREPSTWDSLRCGDDSLALRHADYVRPSVSTAFAQLKDTADPDVRSIALFLESMLSHEPQRLPALEDCTNVVATLGSAPPSDDRFWRLSPLAVKPLEAGIYREPYAPLPAGPAVSTIAAVKPPRPLSPMVVRGGAGVVASAGGYWASTALGFAPAEYLAVVLLGWTLAVILAVASRGSKPPGGSTPP